MHRSLRTAKAFARATLGLALVVTSMLVAVFSAGATAHPAIIVAGRPRPTIVLVHGAWANTASWSGVIERLQAEGYTVYAPPNPLRSLKGDAQTIADFLKTIKGPIVLVGHSYGGAVITNAANGIPNEKALVYVDAFAPAPGRDRVRTDRQVPRLGTELCSAA
jgi:pimeloyl-ACP methyl ester carboxylesterase